MIRSTPSTTSEVADRFYRFFAGDRFALFVPSVAQAASGNGLFAPPDDAFEVERSPAAARSATPAIS
jgi:hypothetical protein